MKNIILKTAVLLLLVYSLTSATSSYISYNKYTRELCWFEEGGIISYNGLFWKPLSNPKAQEIEYLEQGYKHTTFPYKIEAGILILLGIVLLFRYRSLDES